MWGGFEGLGMASPTLMRVESEVTITESEDLSYIASGEAQESVDQRTGDGWTAILTIEGHQSLAK